MYSIVLATVLAGGTATPSACHVQGTVVYSGCYAPSYYGSVSYPVIHGSCGTPVYPVALGCGSVIVSPIVVYSAPIRVLPCGVPSITIVPAAPRAIEKLGPPREVGKEKEGKTLEKKETEGKTLEKKETEGKTLEKKETESKTLEKTDRPVKMEKIEEEERPKKILDKKVEDEDDLPKKVEKKTPPRKVEDEKSPELVPAPRLLEEDVRDEELPAPALLGDGLPISARLYLNAGVLALPPVAEAPSSARVSPFHHDLEARLDGAGQVRGLQVKVHPASGLEMSVHFGEASVVLR